MSIYSYKFSFKENLMTRLQKCFLLWFLCLCDFAFGAGGIDRVNSFAQNIATALYGVGAIILTIAIMWAGFKIMYQGQTLREIAPTLIGGVCVGAASSIAAYLVN